MTFRFPLRSLGFACLLLSSPAPAFLRAGSPMPASSLAPFEPVDLGQPERWRRELTLRVVAQMADPGFRALVESRLGPGRTRVSLIGLADAWAALEPAAERQVFTKRLRELDRDLRAHMGIEAESSSILDLEYYGPGEDAAGPDWSRVLFAVRPGPKAPASLEAYDGQGRRSSLDAGHAPEMPVLIAGADGQEVVRAGVAAVNRGLLRAGWSRDPLRAGPAGPVDCTKLAEVQVLRSHDLGWWNPLEVYALVSGVDPSRDKPSLRLVQMPYLVREGRPYRPNQVLVFWSDYRYGAANVQFWQHADANDYQALLSAILKGIAEALEAAGAASVAWIPAIADAIIRAMPTHWWNGTDALLDTFYTLEMAKAYPDVRGAAGAVRAGFAPWVLPPR